MKTEANEKIKADREKARARKVAEEDKFKQLREQRQAARTLEMGKLRNENL